MSVVRVLTKPNGTGGGGTGFIVKGNTKNYTVTNYHVCNHDSPYMYADRRGEFSDVKLRIVTLDYEHDLCLLEPAPGYPLPTGQPPSQFDELIIFGHPKLGLLAPASGVYRGQTVDTMPMSPPQKGSCYPGTVPIFNAEGLRCDISYTLGATTIPTFRGNSGSPVLNVNLEVVGVMQSFDDTMFYGQFVPVQFLKELLAKLP